MGTIVQKSWGGVNKRNSTGWLHEKKSAGQEMGSMARHGLAMAKTWPSHGLAMAMSWPWTCAPCRGKHLTKKRTPDKNHVYVLQFCGYKKDAGRPYDHFRGRIAPRSLLCVIKQRIPLYHFCVP